MFEADAHTDQTAADGGSGSCDAGAELLVGLIELRRVVDHIGAVCGALEPDDIPVADVAAAHAACVRGANMMDGARMRMAGRVAATKVWDESGERSAADYLARTQGMTRAAAAAELAAAKRIAELAATDDAVRAGRLSPAQAATVADAATADPEAEDDLLSAARKEPVSQLRARSRRVKAAADPDPEATYKRIHRNRYARRWTDEEGAYNLIIHGTALDGARIDAVLAPVINDMFKKARREGRHEHADAHVYDAVLALLTDEGMDVDDIDVEVDGADGAEQDGAVPADGADGAARADGAEDEEPPRSEAANAQRDGAEPDGADEAEQLVAFSNASTYGGIREHNDKSGGQDDQAAAGRARGAPDAGPSPTAPKPKPKTKTKLKVTKKKRKLRRIPRGRETKIIVRVDVAALRRGYTVDGETCEIDGVGTIPVCALEYVLPTAVAALVIRDGVDVVSITHMGRNANAFQQTALEDRGLICEVPDCGSTHGLERDHIEPYAKTKRTVLKEIAWLCAHHHKLKTNEGWRLSGPVGNRKWSKEK